jgi:hypothetical protein
LSESAAQPTQSTSGWKTVSATTSLSLTTTFPALISQNVNRVIYA